MSFTPPPPGSGREALERALAAPNQVLREDAGLTGSEPMPGFDGVDLERALAAAEHEFMRFRDLSVHMEVHAVGPDSPTVVVHHGLGDHVRRFTPLAGRLAEAGFNTVAVDRPGHGLSGGHRGHCPLPWALEVVDASLRWARARYGGPVIMVGDSLGGFTLWYSLTRDVDADAVLCHCIAHPEVEIDPSMRWKRPLMGAIGRIAGKAPVPIRQLADYDHVALDPRTQASFDSERDDVFNFHVTAGSAASYLGFRPDRPWEQVRTPVEVWIGSEDLLVTPEFTRRCFERAHPPTATYVELPGQGHQVFLDHLDQSFPRLLEWIDEALG